MSLSLVITLVVYMVHVYHIAGCCMYTTWRRWFWQTGSGEWCTKV